MKELNADVFRDEIESILVSAEEQKKDFVDIVSGDLHSKFGRYPGSTHQMPNCCSVMRRMMNPGDIILDEPLKGQGATLKIRYMLPR